MDHWRCVYGLTAQRYTEVIDSLRKETGMQRHIDEQTAHSQLSQILDLAANDKERYVVDRPGSPAVIIMGFKDYLRLTAPDWMKRAWEHSKENGLDTMTMNEIAAEIAEYRREKAQEIESAGQ